jgi:2-polyprenyl-3-methyl-5-hydroxy-6-metoxy-1,4-benzoquinol methylase
MQTQQEDNCTICKSTGELLYKGLKDQLFSARGDWNIFVCPTCKLLWLNPFPIPEELSKIYGSYYTHDETNYYAGKNIKKSLIGKIGDYLRFQVYRSFGYKDALLKSGIKYRINIGGRIPVFKNYILLDMLRVHPSWGKKLLDVGAGNGEFLKLMKMLGWVVEGTETDERAVNYARSNHALTMHLGFLSDIKLPDNTYDVITLSHVIEHVFNPEELMLECKRLLKPGGRLVILTPNSGSLAHRKFGKYWRGLEIPRHMFVFSVKNFSILAQKTGFICETLTSSARIARYLYSTSTHIKQGKFNIGEGGNRGYYLAFKSYIFQAYEEFIYRFNKNCGEEIYFVGRKV